MFLLTTMVRRKTQAKVNLISCAGATNWFGVGLGKGVNWESPTVPWIGLRFAINGVFYTDDDPEGVAIWASSVGGYTLPDDYPIPVVEGGAFRNISNSNLRLEYQLLPENQDQLSLLFFGDNPTIVELGNNHWGVCLSPAEQELPQISCDGATDYLGFERLDGNWDTYVDGVFYPSPYNPAPTIRDYLSDIIAAQDDGFADFWNIDTTAPHRIMFVPRNTEGNPNSYILRQENTNQSFMELPDGSLVFCLSPKAYYLAIDDKGLVPSDGIYSGTITPPLPSAILRFNIQQHLPNGNNGLVFSVYSDAQGLVVSPDGTTWQVDKTNLASWFDNFPDASDFTTAATYEFTISKMLGDENLIPGELDYIVN